MEGVPCRNTDLYAVKTKDYKTIYLYFLNYKLKLHYFFTYERREVSLEVSASSQPPLQGSSTRSENTFRCYTWVTHGMKQYSIKSKS